MILKNKSLGLYICLILLCFACSKTADHKMIQHSPVMHKAAAMAIPSPQLQRAVMPASPLPLAQEREKRAEITPNPIQYAAKSPVSTFSIDVDTGAYSNIRSWLNRGILPQSDQVRLEEMINYFDYHYPRPTSTTPPFSVQTEVSPTPWNAHTHLLHIGIQGYEPSKEELPAANLVFLLDVSGSMKGPQRLGLLKTSLKMLIKQLSDKDTVAIVVYAGAAGVVLEPTPATKQGKIIAALNGLSAGGSTNGGAGIQLAYQLAKKAFIKGGINRVIMASDGDVNVGTTGFDALLDLVKQQRQAGIALTTLGFGMGNYNDRLMEQLADVGNGQHAYIDTLNEARKVLVDEVSSTLLMIAKDVKIQVEFNPEQVAEYRLIGYENRMLQREDFNNDKVDAGDIGAGHSVTALYEIALVGSKGLSIDPLRYAKTEKKQHSKSTELAFLRLRYKQPDSETSQLIEIPIAKTAIIQDTKETSNSFRFAAAVAAYGELLRGGKYSTDLTFDDVIELALGSRGKDEFSYRAEFISLVRTSKALMASQ